MSVEYLVYNEICSTQLILERFTTIAPEFTERLQSIWKQMGIGAKMQRDRVEAVVKYIQELLSDMVTDEENLLKELMKNIEIYEVELLSVAQILGFPPYEVKEDLSLIEKEKDLRTQLDVWKLEKNERIKKCKSLREKEDGLCKRLDLPPHDTSIGEVPTTVQVKEIEANIDYMERELAQAKIQFQQTRQIILKLWEELEVNIAETKFSEIASPTSEDVFILSKENLQQMKEYLSELEKQQQDDRQEGSELMRKLKSLWMKLEINENDQCAFKENCLGFRPSSIQKLRIEVDKYESMKMKYTEKFILGSRKELKHLWDKCFFSTEERMEFSPAFDENYTEESLNLHEHQIRILQGFYEDNKAMFKLVEKREMMWKKLMEFENKENDPARLFTNRGGALLKELKMKNAVEKGLPKVEEDLKKMVKLWEEENDGFFFVNGQKYLELIKTQQNDRKTKKDLLKLGKQKEKKEAIAKEMVYGSKPVTPAKRAGRHNASKFANQAKRKPDDQCSHSSTISMTSSSSLAVSQYDGSVAVPILVKTRKKNRNSRRLSSKIKKHPYPSLRRCLKDDIQHISREDEDVDENNATVESLCTYPDFTSHIRRGTEKELSSTAATVESFESLSPTNDESL